MMANLLICHKTQLVVTNFSGGVGSSLLLTASDPLMVPKTWREGRVLGLVPLERKMKWALGIFKPPLACGLHLPLQPCQAGI